MKLAVGTVKFGTNYGLINKKKIYLNEIKKISKFINSKINNINLIDTAFSYGKSHKIIGRTKLNKLKIVTKIRFLSKNKINYFNKNIDNLLKDLRVDKIYGLLFHDVKDAINKSYLKLLLDLKKKKIIKKIGVSIYSPNDLKIILKLWKPDIVQVPFNIFDQRLVKSGYLDLLKKLKIEIHVRSCFLQGLLVNYDRNKKKFKKFQKWSDLLESWSGWCRNNNISKIEACLQFIKNYKKIDYLVVGFDNLKQLKEIIYTLGKKEIKITNKFYSSDLKLIDPRKWN
jgi:aryl-alcohol dehydrogenase-like predicted oxidoreductase